MFRLIQFTNNLSINKIKNQIKNICSSCFIIFVLEKILKLYILYIFTELSLHYVENRKSQKITLAGFSQAVSQMCTLNALLFHSSAQCIGAKIYLVAYLMEFWNVCFHLWSCVLSCECVKFFSSIEKMT